MFKVFRRQQGIDIGCKVSKTVDQLIATSTVTTLTWDDEDYDTDSMHDNAVNNERITFNRAGKYLIIFTWIWDPDSVGQRFNSLARNGTIIARWRNDAVGQSEANISTIFDMNAGDFATVDVFQSSGVGINILTDPSTRFMAQKIDRGG